MLEEFTILQQSNHARKMTFNIWYARSKTFQETIMNRFFYTAYGRKKYETVHHIFWFLIGNPEFFFFKFGLTVDGPRALNFAFCLKGKRFFRKCDQLFRKLLHVFILISIKNFFSHFWCIHSKWNHLEKRLVHKKDCSFFWVSFGWNLQAKNRVSVCFSFPSTLKTFHLFVWEFLLSGWHCP